MPEPTHARPAGTPFSMAALLTSPLVIWTVLAADSVRSPWHGLALRASSADSTMAMICMVFMLPKSAPA